MEQFQQKKDTALGKRDKSNAGRIDPKAVDICAAINSSPRYYTTSSCAGRCFIYTGDGIKSHHHYLTTNPNNNNDNGDDTSNRHGFFQRYRVNHDLVRDPQRYFNLNTISTDLSGGGDPVRETNQFEGKKIHNNNDQKNEEKEESTTTSSSSSSQLPKYYADSQNASQKSKNKTLWLRFEPFILHVCCFNQNDANRLMNAARPAFKNVGLTSIQKNIVALWGDEGLDMPLSVPVSSNNMNDDNEYGKFLFESNQEKEWLQSLVNERHVRNWQKIDRFTQHVHEMLLKNDDDENELDIGENESADKTTKHRRSYDVIGDVAIIVASNDDNGIVTKDMIKFGEAILKKNKHIKVVLARTKPLSGTDRSPSGGNSSESSSSASSSSSSGLEIVCGGPPERLLSLTQKNTFITSHTEYGIKCVVDLQHLFFSPRMASERLRICQQIARSERICVLFCGVGMEVLQIAGRNEIKSMLAVDLNERAIRCLERGKRMLERNKSLGKDSKEKADKIEIVHGDVLDVLKKKRSESNEAFVKFDRILAPRPKEVTSSIESSMDTNHDDTPTALKNKIVDGDLGDGSGGLKYLRAIMSVLKEDGGECHWYDFCADWEIHNDNGKGRCERTCQQILMVAKEQQLRVEILHIAKVGSVAKRQFRVCVDFRLNGRDDVK